MTFAFAWLGRALATPLGREIAAGLLVVGLLTGAYFHAIHKGQEQGKQEGQAAASAQMNQQKQADEKQTAATIANIQVMITALEQRAQQAQQQAEASRQLVAVIAGQRQAAQQQVAQVADADLHSYNKQQLGASGNDVRLPYSVPEERQIASAITQQPLLVKQAQAQSEQITQVSAEVAALRAKVDAQASKYDALADYTGRLEGYYAAAYDAIPRRRNLLLSVVTLGFKGKPAKARLPNLNELRAHP